MDSPDWYADFGFGLYSLDSKTENAKDTLCRNVTIYGRCRYEDKGFSLDTLSCEAWELFLTEYCPFF